ARAAEPSRCLDAAGSLVARIRSAMGFPCCIASRPCVAGRSATLTGGVAVVERSGGTTRQCIRGYARVVPIHPFATIGRAGMALRDGNEAVRSLERLVVFSLVAVATWAAAIAAAFVVSAPQPPTSARNEVNASS